MIETDPSIADLDTALGSIRHTTAEEAAKAARTAARYATDADELRMLLGMLGLHGAVTPPPCTKCGEPVTRETAGGYHCAAGDGLCGRCYKAEKKRESAPRAPRETASCSGICRDCDRRTAKRPTAGEVPYGGRGRCTTCYQRLRRQETSSHTVEFEECGECGRPRAKTMPCPFCRRLVDAKPVIAHLNSLKVLQMTDAEIAAESGVAAGAIAGLLYSGPRRVGHRTAERIRAVRPQGRTTAEVELLVEMCTPLGVFAPGHVVQASWTEHGWRLSLLPGRDDHAVVVPFADVAVHKAVVAS